jgi:hypothetical protein
MASSGPHKRRRHPALLIALLVIAAGSGLHAARAADEGSDADTRTMAERCIPLSRVRDVRIVDDHTIIWDVMGDIPQYRMTLDGKCPGLVNRGAFVHSSSNNRLCDIGDWIRVAGGSRAICNIKRIEPNPKK